MPLLDLTAKNLDLRVDNVSTKTLQFTQWNEPDRLTPFDFTDFTGWSAKAIAKNGDEVALAVDTSDSDQGIYIVTFVGTDLAAFPKNGNYWNVSLTDPSSNPLVLVEGNLIVQEKPS